MAAIPNKVYIQLGNEIVKSTNLNVHRKNSKSTNLDHFFSILKFDQNSKEFDGHISGHNIEIIYKIDMSQQVVVTYRGNHTQGNAEIEVIKEVRRLSSRIRTMNQAAARAKSNGQKQHGRRGTSGEFYLQSRKVGNKSKTITEAENLGLISNHFGNNAHRWDFTMWKKK